MTATLLFLTMFAAAQSAAGTAVAPAPDALVEEMVAAMPPESPVVADIAEFRRLTARLDALNPRREAEVRPITDRWAQCLAPAGLDLAHRNVREAARSLGAAKVRRLILLYRSPQMATLTRIADTPPEALGPADRRVVATLLRDYPIQEFAAALDRVNSTAAADPAMREAKRRCFEEAKAAMERAKLTLR